MSSTATDDFAFLAIVDAYRWWINHDLGFLQATKMIDSDGRRTARELAVAVAPHLQKANWTRNLSQSAPFKPKPTTSHCTTSEDASDAEAVIDAR